MENELEKKQFDILECLTRQKMPLTQRQLSELTGHSLGTINRLTKELTVDGLLHDGRISEAGLSALEPYRAKRAVFLAAGFGSRLVPITLNTPKPLIRVNGIRIIDRLLDACLAIGITEIYIVRGYLAEQFDQLRYKYPTIHFLENPLYNESNNISSIMCARQFLKNAYVFESDILLNKPDLITKYHYTSDVLGIAKERTDDWCFTTKNKLILSQQLGGINCYQEVGISYLNAEDGSKLFGHIEQSYAMPGGKEKFWDQVQHLDFKSEYNIQVRECYEGDMFEIDTFNELKQFDKSYES